MSSLSTKQKIIRLVVLVVLGLGIGAFVAFRNPKTPEPQPVVEQPKTNEPIYEQIGSSVEGRKIEAYTYGTGSTTLMFVGGMHGGYEWNSVLLAYDFMDYLKEHPDFIPKNLSITIIPSANPDGVYKVIGKEGRFTVSDVPTKTLPLGTGRFNAHDVDLNRNFDCNWKPKSTWQNKTVSAGTAAFSEPEAQAIKNYVDEHNPVAGIFWHSKSNAVYASQCNKGILPQTLDIMNAYAKAAGYPAVKSFDAYPVTGDSEGWLASVGIPAITVEMKTHETVEWDKNLAGVKALLQYYNQQ